MENFVKIEGVTYFESQLRLMNENQLNQLIKKCQKGIDEIAIKQEDFRNCNYDSEDIEHYNEVMNKFEAASVYLQSDIVLISRIIKAKSNVVSVVEQNDWYYEFFHTVAGKISRRKMQKLIKINNNKLGYEIKIGD